MSAALYNLAAMTVASTGTGTITLGSAATINGVLFLSFAAAGVPDGAQVYYSINDVGGSEVGLGTYTSSGTTLTRGAITSTNSNNAINMTSAAIVRISPVTSQFREVLTANRTYYVLTTGSDSNTGLANTAAGAFLTIQKAVNVACGLDLSIYSVTINVGAGTYTGAVVLGSYVGVGPITITGDTTTPSNVVISTTSASCVTADGVLGSWRMGGFKFQTTTTGHAFYVVNGSVVTLNGLNEFGAVASGYSHFVVANYARVTVTANYTISGNAHSHALASAGGLLDVNSLTITISSSPTMTYYYRSIRLANITAYSMTYSGSLTAGATRYQINMNSILETGGATTSVPGSVAGTTATGGQAA